jgi:hypothetical protein
LAAVEANLAVTPDKRAPSVLVNENIVGVVVVG